MKYLSGDHAEQAVLGSLLMDNSTWDEVGDQLKVSDFGCSRYREIFTVIKELLSQGKNADLICVADILQKQRAEEVNTSFIELCDISKGPFSTKNIKYYAEIVKNQAVDRGLLNFAHEVMTSVQEQQKDRLDHAQRKLHDIAESISTDIVPPGEIIKTIVESIDQRQLSSSDITGLQTGFDGLDDITHGLQNGNLILIAGRPSMGKTLLGVNIAEHVALHQKKAVAIFSMEMSKEQLMERIIASVSGLEGDKVSYGRLNDEESATFLNASALLSDAPLFIDDRSSRSVADIRATCRRIKRARNLALVLVDYITLMSAEGENETLRIGQISRELKMLARDLNVPVIAISQLNRAVENRVDKRPCMADLRQSGAIEQDADLILFIYRDEVYNASSTNKGMAEIIVAKHRMGRLGTFYLKFNGRHSRFENCSAEYVPSSTAVSNKHYQPMNY